MRLSNRMTSRELEERSGVSHRQIRNILNGASAPTTETVDALAKAFGLQGWHLLLPNLPDDLANGHALAQLVDGFINSDVDGRELTLRMLKRKAS
jgi:transcriptional regulator with XRE-family HTH domain